MIVNQFNEKAIKNEFDTTIVNLPVSFLVIKVFVRDLWVLIQYKEVYNSSREMTLFLPGSNLKDLSNAFLYDYGKKIIHIGFICHFWQSLCSSYGGFLIQPSTQVGGLILAESPLTDPEEKGTDNSINLF